MARIIILKNTTGTSFSVRGKSIPALGQEDFTNWQGVRQYRLSEDEITVLIDAGDLVVNDSVIDLSVDDAKLWLFTEEIDFTFNDISFADLVDIDVFTTPPVTGDILEWDGDKWVPVPHAATDTPAGKMFQLSFENPSSVGGDWLQLGGFPSNETPHVLAWDCKLVALTFSNKESGADTELQIQAVDEGDGRSPSPTVFTWILDNVRTARKTDFSPDVTFSKGDKIAIFAKQRGNTDPSQVKMIMTFFVTAADETNNVENWSDDIS